MLLILDDEIERLKALERSALIIQQTTQELQEIVAAVPSNDVIERWIRYETHLARQWDRLWSQLERCQERRLGQPSPPAVRLEFS